MRELSSKAAARSTSIYVTICPTAEQNTRLLLVETTGKNSNEIDAKDTGVIMDCSGCTRI
jgi:hypothetical protein